MIKFYFVGFLRLNNLFQILASGFPSRFAPCIFPVPSLLLLWLSITPTAPKKLPFWTKCKPQLNCGSLSLNFCPFPKLQIRIFSSYCSFLTFDKVSSINNFRPFLNSARTSPAFSFLSCGICTFKISSVYNWIFSKSGKRSSFSAFSFSSASFLSSSSFLRFAYKFSEFSFIFPPVSET